MSFRFGNPMDRVVRLWAKIWRGPSNSQTRFYPIGFCNIGLHKKTDPFIRSKSKNLKLGIASRIRICLFLMSHCGATGLMSYRSYRCVRYGVVFYRAFRSVRYWYRCCTDTRTNSRTDVHTGTGGTGIDVVPNLPTCPVPVLM